MLIFLDIDGVMVLAKGWKSPEFLSDGFPVFSSKATIALQRLISDDVTVVLTTSHKGNFSLEEWKTMFKNRGIHIKNLIALPANSSHLSRRDEIINWFSINQVDESFIIIDDDNSLNNLPLFLKSHLVQTSPYIGLTEAHVEVAKSILYRNLQPE